MNRAVRDLIREWATVALVTAAAAAITLSVLKAIDLACEAWASGCWGLP